MLVERRLMAERRTQVPTVEGDFRQSVRGVPAHGAIAAAVETDGVQLALVEAAVQTG